MALIICPECGKQFSDKAAACPNCGCPTSEIVKSVAPKGNSADAEKQMLALVEQTLEKARKAGSDYELAADEVQNLAERTNIDLFGGSARQDTSRIVEAAVNACDALYTAYQDLIPTLDGGCRPLLAQNPGAKAVKAVAGTMVWLNEESKIENNYAITFNGADLGNAVKAKYLPNPLNLSIQGYWEAEYAKLPNHTEAEKYWKDKLAEHRRKAAHAESDARLQQIRKKKEARKAVNDFKEQLIEENKKKTQGRERYYANHLQEIVKAMKYYQPAIGLISHGYNAGASVLENGTVHVEDKPFVNHGGDDASEMHDICQILALDYCGFVGLRRDGTVTTSRIGSESKKKSGLRRLEKWNNIRKIVKTVSSDIIGLRYDGTCINIGSAFSKIDVSAWTNVVDIVASDGFVAGLREDGTVCASGTTGDGYDLEKVKEWRDILLLAVGNFELLGVNKAGQLLQIGKDKLDGLTAAKDIMTIVYGGENAENYFALQSDGTVVGGVKDWSGAVESKQIQGLSKVAGIYHDDCHHGCIALLKDGSIRFFGSDIWRDGLDDNLNYFKMPLLKNYDAYQKKENARVSELETAERKKREEEALRAERRANGLCQHCGGELEKKLFGWRCKTCGQRKDY